MCCAFFLGVGGWLEGKFNRGKVHLRASFAQDMYLCWGNLLVEAPSCSRGFRFRRSQALTAALSVKGPLHLERVQGGLKPNQLNLFAPNGCPTCVGLNHQQIGWFLSGFPKKINKKGSEAHRLTQARLFQFWLDPANTRNSLLEFLDLFLFGKTTLEDNKHGTQSEFTF